MSEPLAQVAETLPQAEPVIEAPPEPMSISEHASLYGPKADDADPVVKESAEAKADAHHSAEQKRERETGKFEPGKVRHRAASQQAGARDVPRIQALTGRAKTAEERLAAAEAEIVRLKATPQTSNIVQPQQQQPPRNGNGEIQRRAPEPVADPEPTEADAKYGNDYGKYLVAHARWAARDEHKKWEVEHQARRSQERAQQTVAERVRSAQQKYPDFDAVANRVMARIPVRSTAEAWIFEHDRGDDVLVYFDTHPEELDAILRMPRTIHQVDALTLLAQRFASSSHAQAGTTGSAAVAPTIVLPPRPPNPVRTEAQRASEGPPTDRPLTIAEHAKYYGPKARH